MTIINSTNTDYIILQSLVQLRLQAPKNTTEEINKRVNELFSLIDTSSSCDKEKLKKLVSDCQQKILEEKSDLYKVVRILRSCDNQPATINFLINTLWGVLAERCDVSKMYEYVMAKLLEGCIIEKSELFGSCFAGTHEHENVLKIPLKKGGQFTPESFSLCSRLFRAAKTNFGALESELVSILKDERALEDDSRAILEYWKHVYLKNVVSKVVSAFEDIFLSTAVLPLKIDYKRKRDSLSEQERATTPRNEALERFYTEEVETMVSLYCRTMPAAKEGQILERAQIEMLARSIVELGEKVNQRLRKFEPTYRQLWNFLSPHLAEQGMSELVSPSAFVNAPAPIRSIDCFIRTARSFAEPEELSRLCMLGYDAFSMKCSVAIAPRFAVEAEDGTTVEKELVEPLKKCEITKNVKPVRNQTQLPRVGMPPTPPKEKPKRTNEPAKISFNEGYLVLAERVTDWYKKRPAVLDEQPYVSRSPEQNMESQLLHTYPIIVTKLITKHCTPEKYKGDTLYTCPGTISSYERNIKIYYEGYFADCVGSKSGKLYHHFFHQKAFPQLIANYANHASFLGRDENEIKEEAKALQSDEKVVDSREVADRFVIQKKRYSIEIDDTQKKLRYTLYFPEGLR